jgi:hypothetical protein
MSLQEAIKKLSGNKRKFLLLRIADMDAQSARKLTGVKIGTYNSWLQQEDFVSLYRQRDVFNAENKQEAIQMLRRDNQLEAVLLEGRIIKEMKAELETKEYNLLRTNLAREVYSKLISDLDATPTTQILSWEQRIANITTVPPQEQVIEGEIIHAISEADSEQETESVESQSVQTGKQAPIQVKEESEEDEVEE